MVFDKVYAIVTIFCNSSLYNLQSLTSLVLLSDVHTGQSIYFLKVQYNKPPDLHLIGLR